MASGSLSGVSEELAADYHVTVIRDTRLTPEHTRAPRARPARGSRRAPARAVVGQTFPLERAGEAHAAIEARAAIGKTLLTV